MTHFTIIDYTGWQPYEGLAAGSGRSEKEWLISDDGRIGLFKYPKIDPATNSVTTEHISEHMAAQIGNILQPKQLQHVLLRDLLLKKLTNCWTCILQICLAKKRIG